MTGNPRYRRSALLGAGAAAWALGTAFYYFYGRGTFEAGAFVYVTNVLIAGLLYVLLFRGLARAAGVPADRRAEAALVFILPGMAGEIPLLMFFEHAMPMLRIGTAGPYAAFLFVGYVSTGLFALLWQEQGSS